MLKNNKYAIINSDDPSYQDFIFKRNFNITYGLNGEYRILDYELKLDKTFITYLKQTQFNIVFIQILILLIFKLNLN